MNFTMFMLNNGNRDIELKASAAAYRKLKLVLGCNNLKAAFFAAFENVDIEFLIYAIECFGKVDHKAAEEFVDEAFEARKLQPMFANMADFINGMGFFGDLGLEENVPAVEYFKNPLNRVDMNEAMANAMHTAMNESVTEMVKDQIQKENKEKDEEK